MMHGILWQADHRWQYFKHLSELWTLVMQLENTGNKCLYGYQNNVVPLIYTRKMPYWKKNIVLETWSELVLDPQQGTYPHWISHTFWSCFPFMLVAPNIYECLWDCYLYYRSFILISPDPPYKRIINKMAITMILP